MNAEDKMKQVVNLLSESGVSDKVTKKLLSDLVKLEKTLDATGDLGNETVLKLPYSSMPKLKSKCWA